jgi:hypothetical protein
MKLYLGEGVYINNTDIVGIFDIERTTVQKDTKEFLARLKRKAVSITNEMPKSFVVTGEKTYISEKGVGTLIRRVNRNI